MPLKIADLKKKALEVSAKDSPTVLSTDQADKAIALLRPMLASFKKRHGRSMTIYNNKRKNFRSLKFFGLSDRKVVKSLAKAGIKAYFVKGGAYTGVSSIVIYVPLDYSVKIGKSKEEPKPLRRKKTSIGVGKPGSKTYKTHVDDFMGDIEAVLNSYGFPAKKIPVVMKALEKLSA